MMFRPLLSVMLGATLVAGCAKREPLVATADLQVVQDVSMPAPNRSDLVSPRRPALIGPLDTLSVVVFGVAELSGEVTVDTGGDLSLPLVGTVEADGKTPAEVAAIIDGRIRGRYVRDPNVSVSVKESVSQVVTIDGSVAKPGQYPATSQATLMRVIALGGGLSDFAKLDDVVILRTVNNQRMAGLYNLGAIRRGAYSDPAIYPNDVVIVGDSPSRRLFRDLVTVASLATAPLVAVLSRN